jgi:hypothetical protein
MSACGGGQSCFPPNAVVPRSRPSVPSLVTAAVPRSIRERLVVPGSAAREQESPGPAVVVTGSLELLCRPCSGNSGRRITRAGAEARAPQPDLRADPHSVSPAIRSTIRRYSRVKSRVINRAWSRFPGGSARAGDPERGAPGPAHRNLTTRRNDCAAAVSAPKVATLHAGLPRTGAPLSGSAAAGVATTQGWQG